MCNALELPSTEPAGQQKSSAELLPILYDELRQLAAQKLAREAPDQTPGEGIACCGISGRGEADGAGCGRNKILVGGSFATVGTEDSVNALKL